MNLARLYFLVAAAGGTALLVFLVRSLYRYTGLGWPRRKGQPNLTRDSNPIFFWFLTIWAAGGAVLSALIVVYAVVQLRI
jgi:hypothetical protein